MQYPGLREDGVSPIVGTLLILVLGIVLTAIVFVFFMGSADVSAETPILGLSIKMEGTTVLISHLNGETLPEGCYAVLIDGVEKPFIPSANFLPGMTLRCDVTGLTVHTVSLVYKNEGKLTLLASKNFD